MKYDGNVRMVDSDLYNICERIKEVSNRLFIVEADDNASHSFVIMEHCDDGVDRMVYKTDELDDRVIKKCQYMLGVPFDQRMKKLEEDNAKWEAEQRENELEMLYEKLGRPMWTQLDHDGFIDGGRGVSFAKRGPKRDG